MKGMGSPKCDCENVMHVHYYMKQVNRKFCFNKVHLTRTTKDRGENHKTSTVK